MCCSGFSRRDNPASSRSGRASGKNPAPTLERDVFGGDCVVLMRFNALHSNEVVSDSRYLKKAGPRQETVAEPFITFIALPLLSKLFRQPMTKRRSICVSLELKNQHVLRGLLTGASTGSFQRNFDQPQSFVTSRQCCFQVGLNHIRERQTTPGANPDTPKRSERDVGFRCQENRRENELRNIAEATGCERKAVPMNDTCVVVFLVCV